MIDYGIHNQLRGKMRNKCLNRSAIPRHWLRNNAFSTDETREMKDYLDGKTQCIKTSWGTFDNFPVVIITNNCIHFLPKK